MILNKSYHIICIVLYGLFIRSHCINSYLYLPDKTIKEEIAVGSFVANLNKELDSNQLYKKKLSQFTNANQFTLLEDSKLYNGNKYFQLDASTGILTTKQYLDRESMCLNRECADACEIGFSHLHSNQHSNSTLFGSCRINLKILLMPSYNILNLNVLIEDINDNKPFFRSNNLTQYINENVPIGYKIPIDLAYDQDVGKNTIQYYELTDSKTNSKSDFSLIKNTFKLLQNLNESQLYLVVTSKLDRELISSYNFTITAYDGGNTPLSSSLNVNIIIVDINDNNPIFEKDIYKFKIVENTQIDSPVGHVKANDLDDGLNGLVKYSFVDNLNTGALSNRFIIQKGSVQSKHQNFLKYFDIDELNGLIKLKTPLDYEDENHFTISIEAKDSGVGSLPSFATVEIEVIDINDNTPEISVSFLNTLFKNTSLFGDFKYDVFIPENTKANKFIAHVSITDRDSGENGKVQWKVLINEKVFASSSSKKELDDNESVLKLIKLNNNSFTLNIGASQLLDREINEYFNISIIAWDLGTPTLPESIYKFCLRLVDINDNSPKFAQQFYDLAIYENNEPFEVISKIEATDDDSFGPNSNITYSIKESIINDYLYIDQDGNLRSKISFDREKIEKYIFHVIATDNGMPSLSSSVMVTLNILDMNDNYPAIAFNTSYYHRFFHNKEAQNRYFSKHSNTEKTSISLLVKINEKSPINSVLIDFKASDKDANDNSKVEFLLDSIESNKFFNLSSDGKLVLIKRLDKIKQSIHELVVLCKDLGSPKSLNSTLKLIIEVTDSYEYCVKMIDENGETSKTKFFNRDSISLVNNQNALFTIDYVLTNEYSIKSNEFSSYYILTNDQTNTNLGYELLTHKELIQIKIRSLDKYEMNNSLYKNNKNSNIYRLEISFKSSLNSFNLSQLMLGKYTIKLKLVDLKNPTCSKTEVFTLLVGNNFINEKEIINFLQTLKQKNNFNSKNRTAANKKISNEYHNKLNSKLNEYEENINDDNEDYGLNENKESKSIDEFNEANVYSNVFSSKNKLKVNTLVKSDYILLFILIVIIVITIILFGFIAFICIYNKYKKQYNKKVKTNTFENKLNMLNENEEDDNSDRMHLSTNRYLTKQTTKSIKKAKKNKKSFFKNSDLNTSSTSSNSTNTSNDIITNKPQYSLVNNKSAGVTSSGTYKDSNEDEFCIASSPNSSTANCIRDKQNITFNNTKQLHQINHPRFLYTPNNLTVNTLSKLNGNGNIGYESNRSNSAADSFIDSTTIDELKSNSSTNDFDLNNKLDSLCQLNSSKNSKFKNNSDPSSSAYSSISNANTDSNTDNHNIKVKLI